MLRSLTFILATALGLVAHGDPTIPIGQAARQAVAEDSQTISGDVDSHGVRRTMLLPPGPGNPRNSEGAFVRLDGGAILFVYSHYYSDRGGDHDPAYLASRVSHDNGVTWSAADTQVLANEGGMNVMSVSLLRLESGPIAMIYLRKNSTADCRPWMRISRDEARSWGEPIQIIPDSEIGYYVLNNDRVIQAKTGRLIAPVAEHNGDQMTSTFSASALINCYLSDDEGKTWRRGKESFYVDDADGRRIVAQEPGVVELSDGRLLMFIRTDAGRQYFCHSSDGGETWTKAVASSLRSPLSPASIKRIPNTGNLLAVWSNNDGTGPTPPAHRTPFTVATSTDNGASWINSRDLESSGDGCYCYTAIAFAVDHVLLGHCAGSYEKRAPLSTTQITSFPIELLYEAK